MLTTRLIKVDPLRPDRRSIGDAATIIKNGGLVAFPTETVYGLGANALDAAASSKIFFAKSRPTDNPLIVHIADKKQLKIVAKEVPKHVIKAMDSLWPGPISFLLKKSDKIPDTVTAGLNTVVVRMPAHPVALELIKQSGVPIAAPSANLSTRPSPTSAEHVMQDLKGRIDMVLDGGDAFFGIESTIVDVTSHEPVLLRPGAITVEELSKYLGKIIAPNSNVREGAAVAPGMKYRHYAPNSPLYVAEKEFLKESMNALENERVGVLCSKETAAKHKTKNVIVMGSEKDMYEIARNLFASLRKLDELKVNFGLIQEFEDKGIGLAIMNRIRKASSHKAVAIENRYLRIE